MFDDLFEEEKEGDFVEYFANGNKRREGRYEGGQKVGKWVQYHPNGNKKSEGTFYKGLYEGHYVSYHKNGNKFREGEYGKCQGNSYDGKKEGVWYQYAEDGAVQQQVTYKHGKVIERVTYD